MFPSPTSFTLPRSCLKAAKPKLSPLCRAAVSSRQAAAAEDVSLDADLQRDCGKERDELCLEAG